MKKDLIQSYSEDCLKIFEQLDSKKRRDNKPIAMVYDSSTLRKHPYILKGDVWNFTESSSFKKISIKELKQIEGLIVVELFEKKNYSEDEKIILTLKFLEKQGFFVTLVTENQFLKKYARYNDMNVLSPSKEKEIDDKCER